MPLFRRNDVVPRQSHKARFKKLEKSLLAERVAKLALLQRLEDEHNVLMHQHQLLESLCDFLAWFREKKTSQEDLWLDILLPDDMEQQLLQQLQALPLQGINDVSGQQTTTSSDTALDQDTSSSEQPSICEAATAQFTASSPVHQHSVMATDAAQCFSTDSPEKHQSSQQQPIAPATDVMLLFKQLSSAPIGPEVVAELTVERLQHDYACLIREVALNLHLHSAQQPAICSEPKQQQQQATVQKTPLQKVEELMVFHLQRLVAVLTSEEQILIHAFFMTNCETGEFCQQGSAQKHKMALSQLNLSQQQLGAIVMAGPVFKRLLNPVLNEQRELQLRVQSMALADLNNTPENEECCGGDASVGGPVAKAPLQGQRLATTSAAALHCSGKSNCTSSLEVASSASEPAFEAAAVSHSSPADDMNDDICMPKPFVHGKQLEFQEKRASRLHVCLEKDGMIKVMAAGYLFGCMSWEQLWKYGRNEGKQKGASDYKSSFCISSPKALD